ncbi:MAG: hypothetical protein H0Z25_06305 [Kosmotoga sp.]|uniref:hypothetical protein n=1 Tax=Kosmotoga sp. TaxID=1955248 RepID=UPI001D8B5619|nr:hypothetical protein [Kosmotoga sp.]MBO8166809.1 hypothetical protein [Kosmotoga sp.]
MKKTLLLLIILFAFGAGFAFYRDIPVDNPYYEAIKKALDNGIFTVIYNADKFEGDTPVTRFEMAVMVNKLLDYTDESKIPLVGELNRIAQSLDVMEKHFSALSKTFEEVSDKAELSLRIAQEMEENFNAFLKKYDSRVDEVDQRLAELSMNLNSIEKAVKNIEVNINDITNEISEHGTRITKLESELEKADLVEMKDMVKTNNSELNRLSKDVDSINSQMRIYMISLLLVGILATIGIFIK